MPPFQPIATASPAESPSAPQPTAPAPAPDAPPPAAPHPAPVPAPDALPPVSSPPAPAAGSNNNNNANINGINSANSTEATGSNANINRSCTNRASEGDNNNGEGNINETENNDNNDDDDDDSGVFNGRQQNLRDAIRSNLLGATASDFSDVTLITPCGARVPACRALLAIRSRYFHNLFFLPFAERTKSDVPIDIPKDALNDVIHFAYTDTCPLLDRTNAVVDAAIDSVASSSSARKQSELSIDFEILCSGLLALRHARNKRRRIHQQQLQQNVHSTYRQLQQLQRQQLQHNEQPQPTSLGSNGADNSENSHDAGNGADSTSAERPRKRRATIANAPSVERLVQLLRAADYVALPALAAHAHDAVLKIVAVHPNTACLAYEAARAEPDPASSQLVECLAAQIRRFPHQTLGVPDIREVTSSSNADKAGTTPLSRAATTTPSAVPSSAGTAMATPATGAEAVAAIRALSGPKNATLSQMKLAPVLKLSEAALTSILSDQDLFTSEMYLFQTIFYWVAGRPLTEVKQRPMSDNDPLLVAARADSERWAAGKRLAKHIDLERLKPSFLVDYVRPCGLVEQDRVNTAFMRQALEAERGRPLFDNFRGGSRWPGGRKKLRAPPGDPSNHPLDTPWVSSGRHEWSFRIVRNAPDIWLGFARNKPPSNSRKFFEGGNGWAFSTGGVVRPETGNEVVRQTGGALAAGPLVWEGGTVKMILNLVKSGTFTIIVDNGPKSYLAFRELKSRSNKFIPIICAAAPAEIELVSERHLI